MILQHHQDREESRGTGPRATVEEGESRPGEIARDRPSRYGGGGGGIETGRDREGQALALRWRRGDADDVSTPSRPGGIARDRPSRYGGGGETLMILQHAIRFYRRFISPLLPRACRFYPTCSQYALEALEQYGTLKGIWLTLKRLSKCHPYHPGGFDPLK